MSESRSWRWIRLGCLGVAAVVVLVLAWAGAVFTTAYWRGQRETVATEQLSRQLPAGPQPVVSEGSRSPVGEVPAAGRVILDLSVGEFFIRAGRPGDPIRVEATYDERSYRMTESWDEAPNVPWTYRLIFEETTWFQDSGLRALLGGSFPKIEITLPPDVPLALEGRFAKGGTELDLGGMWLTEVDLKAEKGGFNIFFDEPLAAPLERLTVRAKQGGASIRRVGNASPRVLEIAHSMGGLSVDLQGEWVCDSDVQIANSFGGGDVMLPEGVLIEGLEDRALPRPPSNDPEIRVPRLQIAVSGILGDMRVIQHW